MKDNKCILVNFLLMVIVCVKSQKIIFKKEKIEYKIKVDFLKKSFKKWTIFHKVDFQYTKERK